MKLSCSYICHRLDKYDHFETMFFFKYLGSRYIVIVVVLVNTIELYIGKYVTFQQFSDDGT